MILPAPGFHHLHLNSGDPDAAIEFYLRQFPASVKAYWGGLPALDRNGMFRAPSAAVVFGDVALRWYVRQGDRPLASTRGHVYDHIGLSVSDLDAWAPSCGPSVSRFSKRSTISGTHAR